VTVYHVVQFRGRILSFTFRHIQPSPLIKLKGKNITPMGGLVSRNKGHVVDVVELDNDIMCPPLPNHTGKFLLQSISNVRTESDGSGGIYLSCTMDGTLSGSKTENDPELWRIQYPEEPHPLLFRIFNTSTKLFVFAGECKQVFTNLEDSDIETNNTSSLFYLIRDKKSEGTYYICSSFQTYLSQASDGKVTLRDFEDCNNNVKWKLILSF
jgi:hypothetical protein